MMPNGRNELEPATAGSGAMSNSLPKSTAPLTTARIAKSTRMPTDNTATTMANLNETSAPHEFRPTNMAYRMIHHTQPGRDSPKRSVVTASA